MYNIINDFSHFIRFLLSLLFSCNQLKTNLVTCLIRVPTTERSKARGFWLCDAASDRILIFVWLLIAMILAYIPSK